MKGIIQSKHIIAAVAIVAVLACLIGLMQITPKIDENAISGVVYESELDHWKDSGYTLATGSAMEAAAADFAAGSQLSTVAPKGSVAHLTAGQSLTVQVEAPKAGLYRIQAEYAIPEESTMNCMLALTQDGEYPYDEAQHIVLPQLLTVGSYPFERNKLGEEIAPIVYNEQIWQTRNFRTMSQSTTDYLLFYLNQGTNEVTLYLNEGEIYLSRLLFDAPEQVPTYEEYRAMYPADQGGNACITLEAERITYKNNTVTRPASSRDIKAWPFESSTHLMNTVGGDTWNTNGSALYYEFDVTEAGWYRFGVKAQKSAKSTASTNTFIHRSISIDGQLPFQEADAMVFPSSGEWEINWLGNSQEMFSFYLTEGTHVLGIEVNSTMLIPVSDRIRELNDQVNDISLEIRKIIGNNTDVYRDWELENYIPGLGQTLYGFADELDVLADNLTAINRGQGMNTSVTSLRICAKQLRTLAEDPDQIPNHMTLLTEGSGSVSQKLGELSESILNQPISIDQIYLVQSEGQVAQQPVSPWDELVEEAAYFLSSFRSKAASEDEKVITVWVNRARNYVDLLQSMIDSDFTVKTGIRVQLSVMPGEQKLILSNTNGTQPDVAMGVSCALPYQLALRGALADLRQFDGFNEVAQLFAPGSHVMHVYGDGIYALTDTQDYYVMYYRTDLLDMEGNPCTVLKDALEIGEITSYRSEFGFWLSAQPVGLLEGSAEVTVWQAETYRVDGCEPLMVTAHSRETTAFVKSLGHGKVLMLGTPYICHLENYRKMMACLGVSPALSEDGEYGGIFMTAMKGENRERYLHMMNLDGFDKHVHVTFEGAPLFGGRALRIASRRALMLPLEMELDGRFLEYATCEIIGRSKNSWTLRLTQEQDVLVFRGTGLVCPCKDYAVSEENGITTVTSLLDARIHETMTLTFN